MLGASGGASTKPRICEEVVGVSRGFPKPSRAPFQTLLEASQSLPKPLGEVLGLAVFSIVVAFRTYLSRELIGSELVG